MSKILDLGPVTDYALAVANGYTGTEAEWISLISAATENAQKAEAQAGIAIANANAALVSETNAKTCETNAYQSESNAKSSENAAKVSEANAALSESNTKSSEKNAKISETNAAASADIALQKADTATEQAAAAAAKAAELSISVNKIADIQAYIGYTNADIYGVEADMTNKTFTRLAGSVGKTAGADFNSINAFGGRKRCILTDNGVRLAYYGDAAYTETGALTQEVTVNSVTYPVGTPVQVMVEQPKFYYKVVPLNLEKITEGEGYHLRKSGYYVSDTCKLGFKVHPAFVSNGVKKDYIYLSAYEGSLYDVSASAYIADDAQVADFTASTGDKLSSIANVKPISGLTQILTRANSRILAHNRGNGWELQTIQALSATQLLFLIEYASFNSQIAIGNGVTTKFTDDSNANMAENTGATTTLGNTSGSVTNTNGYNVVSYRGEENLWGNIWKIIDGTNVYNYIAYVADNSFEDNIGVFPYKNTEFTIARADGYISAFNYNEGFDWLFLPSETTGDSNLPVGDYSYNSGVADTWYILVTGGSQNSGVPAGAFEISASNIYSFHSRKYSCRLSYIPQ